MVARYTRYIWYAMLGILVLQHPDTVQAQNDSAMIAGRWYEDTARSDDLRKFLIKNFHYIDVTAVRFRGTRRGVVVGGDYRRKLSDKQVSELMDFLGSIVPLKPLMGIEQTETRVSLLYDGNEAREISLHGSSLPETRQSTASKKDQNLVLAAWEDGVLVIETNSTSGVRVIEKIGLDKSEEEQALRVEMIIHTPRLPVNLIFNRYYMPHPPLP